MFNRRKRKRGQFSTGVDNTWLTRPEGVPVRPESKRRRATPSVALTDCLGVRINTAEPWNAATGLSPGPIRAYGAASNAGQPN